MGRFGMEEWGLVLLIALVVFGPGKIAGLGKARGKSVHDFRSALNGVEAPQEPEAQEQKGAVSHHG